MRQPLNDATVMTKLTRLFDQATALEEKWLRGRARVKEMRRKADKLEAMNEHDLSRLKDLWDRYHDLKEQFSAKEEAHDHAA